MNTGNHPHFMWVVLTFALLLSVSARTAATPLSTEEIKRLLPGHTVESTDKFGRRRQKIFEADGRLDGKRDSGKLKSDVGKWWVPRDGKVCWTWETWNPGKQWCQTVERDGDRVYLSTGTGKRWELLR